ncbi:MAG: 2-hydroxy-3-oxopropionate reductase [Spirochaetales bacterium]|nr:2-hydroxy-3-oxopropionate reductase [Spirochaetales bacterium]
MMKRIGFIGLGIMGKPMAKNLLKAGRALTVYDVDPAPVHELVAAGATAARSAREAAAASEAVITMLPNSPEVKEAVLGKDGVLEGAQPGTLLIDMSSIAPLAAREIAEAAAAKGVTMLDAPVSGGQPKAIDGTLAVMAGGPEDAFEKVKDLLETMAASVTRVGDVGSGNTAKLANQIIVAGNIAALSEAMVLAAKAGVDPEKVFEAIRRGLAGSTVLEAKMPLVLDGNFKPGFRIELHIKDLNNALDTARALGTPAPLSESIIGMMKSLAAEGKAKDDHGGLIQYYEKLAGTKVRKSR